MARKMEPATPDLQVVDSSGNLKEFDLKTFAKDVEGIMSLREDIAVANQESGARHKFLEKERGYNMKAFKAICGLKKMSPEHCADYLRTLLAGIKACDLYPEADLVDLMSAQ